MGLSRIRISRTRSGWQCNGAWSSMRMGCRRGLALGCLALTSPPAVAQVQPAAPRLELKPVPIAGMADEFTMAAVGDLIYLRPMLATIEHDSPQMLAYIRQADIAFGNLETSVIDLPRFQGSPQAESGGTWMVANPKVLSDLKAMGFGIVSTANNHSTDWGKEGLSETIDHLDDVGLAHAGTGRTLSQARAPAYLDLPGGRVSLVATASSFTPMSRAADPVGGSPGRPGLNPLRTDRVGLVSRTDLEMLARLAGVSKPSDTIKFNGASYRPSATATPSLTVTYDINEADASGNLLAVRQARQNSNFTIVSIHSHEPDNETQTPADFFQPFARRAIDAGASVVIGHGPHQLRGVEIYKGQPIFYSLGNFIAMNNSLDVIPADMLEQFSVKFESATTPEILQGRNAKEFNDKNFYESVIAICRYLSGKLVEIDFVPVDLGTSLSGAARGIPKLASSEVGREILERLQILSKPFGTTILIEKGRGVWRAQGYMGMRAAR